MPFTPTLLGEPTVSVTELNRLVRDILVMGVPDVWISGEISNLTLASSGHAYFSLKDATAQVRCVLFKSKAMALGFELSNGLQVEIKGQVGLYEARGEYQITINTMRRSGFGQLFVAFEALKQQLSAEGLFLLDKKNPIPRYPRAIGIVSSPAAAALRDVVSTLRRRCPSVTLILYPTVVQGSGAEKNIATAIQTANRRAQQDKVDVLIVCRGGGSIEDLWAFNEEAVARAIHTSALPVISGVGHETDFTIADFVADFRAETPTAAAERASLDYVTLPAQLAYFRQQFKRNFADITQKATQKVDYLALRLLHPQAQLQRQTEILHAIKQRFVFVTQQIMAQKKNQFNAVQNRYPKAQNLLTPLQQRQQILKLALVRASEQMMQTPKQRVALAAQALAAYNPHAVLARGYAIVQDQNGTPILKADQLKHRQTVTITLAQGSAQALVDKPDTAQAPLF
ncbi:MAG: exodeoxyribonuclease VII large subunit [Neisseriaceae bacterium]|nr:exodeoxyribonuclease VII large subunit [Neisseriaceae bacterium]